MITTPITATTTYTATTTTATTATTATTTTTTATTDHIPELLVSLLGGLVPPSHLLVVGCLLGQVVEQHTILHRLKGGGWFGLWVVEIVNGVVVNGVLVEGVMV